jgi:hypothetical protein
MGPELKHSWGSIPRSSSCRALRLSFWVRLDHEPFGNDVEEIESIDGKQSYRDRCPQRYVLPIHMTVLRTYLRASIDRECARVQVVDPQEHRQKRPPSSTLFLPMCNSNPLRRSRRTDFAVRRTIDLIWLIPADALVQQHGNATVIPIRGHNPPPCPGTRNTLSLTQNAGGYW